MGEKIIEYAHLDAYESIYSSKVLLDLDIIQRLAEERLQRPDGVAKIRDLLGVCWFTKCALLDTEKIHVT